MVPCQSRTNTALAIGMIGGVFLKKCTNTDGFWCLIEEKWNRSSIFVLIASYLLQKITFSTINFQIFRC